VDQKLKENDDYAVEANEGAGCRLFVRVTVKPKQTQKAYQKAVRLVNKQISIPGFRKGHAPDRTVISRYGSYVDQEWKEILVNDAYRAALDLTDIYPLNKESIHKPKIETCSHEEGAVVLISYEHYPHVPPVDFSQINIPAIDKAAVPEEKISEIFEEIRRAHAAWQTIDGRAVEEGDYVDISIDSIQDAVPKEIVKDKRFEVTDKRLPPWLKNLLLGLKVGETAEGESEIDEQAEEHIKQNFTPTKVRITLHAIKKILLPELNDDLAVKAGASSLEELKGKIHQNLDREAEEERMRRRIKALEVALLEKYVFDLPASLVVSEMKTRKAKQIQTLHQENLSEEDKQMQEAALNSQLSSEVDHDLRLYFLNKQIAKQGKISLTNEELNDEIVRYMSQNPYLYGKETDEKATRELVSRMATALMQRKTKEYALSQVEAA
jgi:trigger factor